MAKDKNYLESRNLIFVAGEDAFAFLQGIITADMHEIVGDKMRYACLLSPQGKILHDFFIWQGHGGYYMDVEKTQAESLLKQLSLYKLRSQVSLSQDFSWHVYAAGQKQEGGFSFNDPRHESLGYRMYTQEKTEADSENIYRDFCIDLGIPYGSETIRYGQDVVADVNLDFLNAISWNKGCYIGQEVTARMKNRGIAKKRLMIIQGSELPGEAGEIRTVNSKKDKALAIVRLDMQAPGILRPDYLKNQ